MRINYDINREIKLKSDYFSYCVFFIFYMVIMSIVAGKVEEINQKKCDRIINNADVHAYISNDDICEAVIIKNNHLAN